MQLRLMNGNIREEGVPKQAAEHKRSGLYFGAPPFSILSRQSS